MITDREFYERIAESVSLVNASNDIYGFTGSVESFADLTKVGFFSPDVDTHLTLGNLTEGRAEFMGFHRLDNGVWLFPRWYSPMLVDGGIYVSVWGDDWIYSDGDEYHCLDVTGEFLTFGVRFDENGDVIA